MSKKHFEALARELAEVEDAEVRKAAALAVAKVAARFNERFDSGRFLRAAKAE